MEKTEQSPFSVLPVQALSLKLARAPIRMQHGPTWRIDKINPVHDLVVCLTGGACYRIGSEEVELRPGQGMLIAMRERFRGWHDSGDQLYTGFAQHFSLDLFGRTDIIAQMRLQRVVDLADWDAIGPLAQFYRDQPRAAATTLMQHHQFMVFLLAYLEGAFLGWQAGGVLQESQEQLSLQIMLTAARLSADPMAEGALEAALAAVPYNEDYFRRAFRDRIGMTPQKYLELKRMEYAVHRLGMGKSVKETAAELGYSDPYFFSRMFKRYIGAPPSGYRTRASSGGGNFEYHE